MIGLILQGTDCMHIRHEVEQLNAMDGRLHCFTRGMVSSGYPLVYCTGHSVDGAFSTMYESSHTK